MGAILVTRPQAETIKLAKLLRGKGREVIECPLIRIELIRHDCHLLYERSLIVSSSNAIRSLDFNNINKVSKIFLIGDKTFNLARELGFVNVEKIGDNAQDIVTFFMEHKQHQQDKFAYYCGDHLTLEITDILSSAGYDVIKFVGYHAHEVNHIAHEIISKIKSGEISEIIFFSNRTVKIFNKLTKNIDLAHTESICISQRIMNELSKRTWKDVRLFLGEY